MLPEPYFERDGVVIYNADCRDVLPHLDPVDHVITDPPYEIEAHTLARSSAGGSIGEYALGFDPLNEEIRRGLGQQFAGIADRWLLVFCQVEAAMFWREALAPARYVRTQIWVKPDPTPQFTGDRPAQGYESIVTAWAGDGRPQWNAGGKSGVYIFSARDADRVHPTQKPEDLMRELVSRFTRPGETILDPFAGSGTTGVAAYHLGRQAILVEREERWCEVAATRLQQLPFPGIEPYALGIAE